MVVEDHLLGRAEHLSQGPAMVMASSGHHGTSPMSHAFVFRSPRVRPAAGLGHRSCTRAHEDSADQSCPTCSGDTLLDRESSFESRGVVTIIGETPSTPSRSLPLVTDSQQPPMAMSGVCAGAGGDATAPRRPDHPWASAPVGPPDLTPKAGFRCPFPPGNNPRSVTAGRPSGRGPQDI